MMQGKVKSDLIMIEKEGNGGPQQFNSRVDSSKDDTVRDVLIKKHPPKQPPKKSAIVSPESPTNEPHPAH